MDGGRGRKEGKEEAKLTNSSGSFKVGVVEILGVSFDIFDGGCTGEEVDSSGK